MGDWVPFGGQDMRSENITEEIPKSVGNKQQQNMNTIYNRLNELQEYVSQHYKPFVKNSN